MIHAYDEIYLGKAQMTLAWMFDYAVNGCRIDVEEFYRMFLTSAYVHRFEKGNCSVVAGLSGVELAQRVIWERTPDEELPQPAFSLARSSEYWLGYSLAYYQWYTGRTFAKIWNAVKLKDIVDMYPVYHEMDIQQFVDRMNELWESYYIDTNLKRIRMLSGYSQRELSELSGVSLRQIQLFEQRQRNINHTKAENVFRLAKILNCKCEDLIEI